MKDSKGKKSIRHLIILILLVTLSVSGMVQGASIEASGKKMSDNAILELGKDPGFNLRKLHKTGITGKGIGIAILDGYILLDHVEYKDRLKQYIKLEDKAKDIIDRHGTAVSSLSVGKSIGVAPDADLYYFNITGMDEERRSDAGLYVNKAVKQIIQLNKTLTKENRIRVISFSASLAPFGFNDYKAYTDAVALAKKEGIFFVSCNLKKHYDFYFAGLERKPESDPNKVSSYKPIDWDRHSYMDIYLEGKKIYPKDQILFAPYDSRTTADEAGIDAYTFDKTGCPSWEVPYIAGLYVLACQVNPDVTPQLFWEKALETGYYVKYDADNGKSFKGKIINPALLLTEIKGK